MKPSDHDLPFFPRSLWIHYINQNYKFYKNYINRATEQMLIYHMSSNIRFPTMWHVLPAKAQTSLRKCAVWSEPLLVACLFNEVSLWPNSILEILSLKGGCIGHGLSKHILGICSQKLMACSVIINPYVNCIWKHIYKQNLLYWLFGVLI